MSQQQQQQLRQYLIDVIDGRDVTINKIYKDNIYYRLQFQMIIENMNLTEQSFEPTLKTIASLLLSKKLLSKNNGRLMVLLLFGMELDSFHSINSFWYKRNMIIETLYNILLDTTFIEEEYSFWKYIFIISSIVLIMINTIC